MIIKNLSRTADGCKIVAFSKKFVYNTWIKNNEVYFYVLSNDNKSNVLQHFVAFVETGLIKLQIDGITTTLDDNDDLICSIAYAVDEPENVRTLLETLFYID